MSLPPYSDGRFAPARGHAGSNDLATSYGTTPVDPDEEAFLVDPALAGATKAHLDVLEAAGLARARAWAVDRRPDLADELTIRTMHRIAFERVWTWAGAYRSVELSIGVEPVQIAPLMAQMTGSLAWRRDEGLLDETDISRTHLALTTIHPFRNGNGRLARLWAALLADACGLPRPSWGTRREYIAALQTGDEKMVHRHLYGYRC